MVGNQIPNLTLAPSFDHNSCKSNLNDKLVRTHSACIWCWDKPRANSDSQDTSRPGLERCHHHPPYSILCVTLPHSHPSACLSRDSQSGVPKLSRFWTPETLGHHSFSPRPPIGTRSEPNLEPSLRAFQRRVALPQRTSKAGLFPTFSGRESNCQFDSRPFFCP
jgi:hypothetical protein